MAVAFLIRAGTVNIVDCDIDGRTDAAIRANGLDGAVTLNVTNCDVGANRLDTLGHVVTSGTEIIDVGGRFAPAPDLVTATLTNVRFSPTTDNAGGHSVMVGTSLVDQLTETGLSYNGQVGTPLTGYFEDYPTIRNPTAIASGESFGALVVSHPSFIDVPGFDAQHFVFDPAVFQQQFVAIPGIASSEAFGDNVVVRGLGATSTIIPAGIPTGVAFGALTVAVGGVVVAPAAIPSGEVVYGLSGVVYGPATLLPVAIPSGEAFGTLGVANAGVVAIPGIRSSEAFGHLDVLVGGRTIVIPGIPSGEHFGLLQLPQFVRITNIPPGTIFGNLTVHVGGATVAPAGIPSGVAFGEVVVVATNTIGPGVGGISPPTPQFGDLVVALEQPLLQLLRVATIAPPAMPHPGITKHFGVSDLYGPIVSTFDVEAAVERTLQTWMPGYLAEVERQAWIDPQSLPVVASWQRSDRPDSYDESALPTVVTSCDGLLTAPVMDGRGHYRTTWGVQCTVVVSAPDRRATRRLAQVYTSALRAILGQQPQLDGKLGVERVEWMDEQYGVISEERTRTIGGGTVVFGIYVADVLYVRAGPETPPENPYDLPLGGNIITSATVDVELLEDTGT